MIDPFLTLGYYLFGGVMAYAYRKEIVDLSLKVFGVPTGPSMRDLACHRYVRGTIGSGKSWLIFNMFLKESQGRGAAIISTHGLKDLLPYITCPERVHIISPARERARGINLLQRYTKDETERLLIADQVISLFSKLDEKAWGANIEELVYNATLAILEAQEKSDDYKDATLYNIYQLLLDEDYREQTLELVSSATIHDVFLTCHPKSLEAAIRRMRKLISNSLYVSALANPYGIDLKQLIDDGDILIADLDSGELGVTTADLIAEVLMSKLYLLGTMRNQYSKFFFCYFDEFQTYSNRYISKFIEEGRKRNMPIVLAHQRAGQLTKDQQEAVSLCGSWYIFRVSVSDAKQLSQAFPDKEYSWQRFVRLPLYKVICREQTGRTISYSVRNTPRLPFKSNRQDEIWKLNSKGYTRSEIVEKVAELNKRGVRAWSSETRTSFDF